MDRIKWGQHDHENISCRVDSPVCGGRVRPDLPQQADTAGHLGGSAGELHYAIGAGGRPPNLAGELLKAMAHVNIVMIAYKGTGSAINALVGGEVQIMFSSTGAIAHHVKSGRLRALAVTTTKPSAL